MFATAPLTKPSARAARKPEPLCADCAYSQVYAIQPRALCTHPVSPNRGLTLSAGQPACADHVGRIGEDLTLHSFRR